MPPDVGSPADEEILAAIHALQRGNGGCDEFAVIYRRFYGPLFTFFSNRPSLREEADDLAQAALLRAYQSLAQYRFEGSFAAWIRQIAENVWRNAVRERQAAKRPVLVAAPEANGEAALSSPLEVVRDPEPDPEAAILAGERTRVLQEAIAALPPGMRTVTELQLFTGLEYRQIADVMGIGLNSVRSQLFEARQRLKPILERYFQGAKL